MKKQIIVAVLFVLILAGGAFLRLENLNRQPYWMDEGYTVNAVISGMQNGTDHFASILDSGKRYFCPMYCLPTAGIVRWADTLQPAGVPAARPYEYRILAALCGILFVALSFIIAKTFFKNTYVALITMFFTSFSTIQIAWSRQARWYTELELFFWLALYFFHKSTLNPSFDKEGLERNSKELSISKLPSLSKEGKGVDSSKSMAARTSFGALALLFSILAIITHPIAYALPIIALVWYVIEIKPTWKHLALVLLGVIGFVALIEYGFGLHTLTSNLATHFSLHNNLLYYASYFWRTYWLFILLGIVGFILTSKEQRKNLILILIPFLLYFIGLCFFTEAIEYRYAFHATLAFYLVGAFGFVELIRVILSLTLPQPLPLTLADSLKGRDFLAKKLKYTILGISIICFGILCFTHLVFTPQSFYWLEADDPAKIHDRDYYAYTPQPDWNAAYGAIKNQLQPGDIVISSHPHFNKIFLNQPGYWIAYDYLRQGNSVPENETHEFYVNATIIHNLSELQTLMNDHHGFIVYDLQSTDNRIDPAIITEITTKGTIVFYDERNNYSKVWVYRF